VEGVREATGADAPRLLELAAELVEALASRRGGPLLLGPDRRLPRDGDDPAAMVDLIGRSDSLVVAGTLGGVVMGFAVCHYRDVGADHRRGVLDACYVEPEARGVGLGRLLLDASMAWLEESGCHGVDGTALPGDREAKNFFESAGFKARLLTMHREIG
jgi:GNAT superfamily N-acetyltransferase